MYIMHKVEWKNRKTDLISPVYIMQDLRKRYSLVNETNLIILQRKIG